jgi:hypothetical protein
MKKVILSLCIALAAVATVNAQEEKKTLNNVANENPNQGDFKFAETDYSYGTIKQGESVTHEFTFINSGKEPIVISSAAGSCGCTVPDYPKEPIMSGQKGTIKVTFNSAGKSGYQDKTVTIQSNAKTNPMVLHIKGTVEVPATAPANDKK